MLFLTQLDIIPGKVEDIFYLVKKLKPPPNIRIREFLRLFGRPDFVIVYEAPDENTAMDFILKFTPFSTPHTSLCSYVEGYEPKEE